APATGEATIERLLDAVERQMASGRTDELAVRGVLYRFDGLNLMAPVPNPSKIVAIGLNYRDHAREQGAPIPERPIIFAKFPTSVIGPGDAIVWDPALTDKVDYEAELAVVIGATARNVNEADAIDFVAGYTCGNDVSARDLQFGDHQWVRGKSLDTFCPLGPVLVTADEISDPQDLSVRAFLNDETMQDSRTSEMIFGVRELIAFASRAFTLLPGDVILTGTPHGVGVFRKPPVFMKDGDRIAIEIEDIGRLENACRTTM
ncbi:MAG: fumarylacetoacetate hydrolase family protein, partial [Acidobacteria bacterium]|nr:fumarylacetoacetate hydrolase family protein [Acidobacteriota bacterium]